MKKPIKVPAINWQDESTWTLAGLSNWAAQRDLKSRAAKDAAEGSVRMRYLDAYYSFIEDAPDWAINMRADSTLLALLIFKFADSPKEIEQQGIQAIIETYSTSIVKED